MLGISFAQQHFYFNNSTNTLSGNTFSSNANVDDNQRRPAYPERRFNPPNASPHFDRTRPSNRRINDIDDDDGSEKQSTLHFTGNFTANKFVFNIVKSQTNQRNHQSRPYRSVESSEKSADDNDNNNQNASNAQSDERKSSNDETTFASQSTDSDMPTETTTSYSSWLRDQVDSERHHESSGWIYNTTRR